MSKLNEDIIIRYLENRCSEEDFVLINEWMKESDENAGELFRMEEIYVVFVCSSYCLETGRFWNPGPFPICGAFCGPSPGR